MTEKRFIMAEPMVTIKDLYFVRDKEQEVYLSISKGIDLLNIQSEYVTKCAKEKAQLTDALNQRTEQCDKLHKENEQLKQEYLGMEIKVGKLKGEIGELFCENEQLKQRIKQLEDNIITKLNIIQGDERND